MIKNLLVPVAASAILATGCAATASTHDVPGSTPHAAATGSTPPAPAPVPSPKGYITGNCDVSLSGNFNGSGNYLTASVTSHNTGNVGIKTRITVFWPLQGFSPVKRAKVVKTGFGQSQEIQFRAPVNDQQISAFQNEQLASSSGNPCHNRGVIAGTYGQAH